MASNQESLCLLGAGSGLALLELPDPYAVIKAQAPTALLLLLVNLGLMLFLA